MTARLMALTGAMIWMAGTAGAAGLCNCCGSATETACTTACTSVTPPAGQCIITVDYNAKAEICPGVNPLYGVSLRNILPGKPSAAQRESFRRMLEAARRGAEADRRASFRDFAHGKIDAAKSDANEKRYGDAMVNYYLGYSAYLATK